MRISIHHMATVVDVAVIASLGCLDIQQDLMPSKMGKKMRGRVAPTCGQGKRAVEDVDRDFFCLCTHLL